jgi:hypothetical protein
MAGKVYFVVSALFFGVVAILHLLRAVNGWVMQVGPIAPPLWASWFGLVVAGALCVWGFWLARGAK